MIRLLSVFKRHILILGILITLVVVSSISKGQTAVVTSTLAGLLMIYAAISFTFYILKTPSRKNKEEIA